MPSIVVTDKGEIWTVRLSGNSVREPESTTDAQHNAIRSVTGSTNGISGDKQE